MDNSDTPSDVATRGRNNGASVVSGITTQPLGTTDDEVFGGVILCGRDNQLATLQTAFDRVKSNATSEVILIGGESGTGKSALMESMRNAVTWNNAGFFVGGKFDQLQAITDPFSAIAAALSDLCDLILQSKQLSEWRERIASSLGSEGCRILSRVVSGLDMILGESGQESMVEPDQPAINNQDFSRFKIYCRKFLSVVARQDHPVLIFLDDLQWADEMSIRLIKSLLGDTESHSLLLCIAYRSDEVDGEVMLDLNGDMSEHLPYAKVQVGRLNEFDLSLMLSQLLFMNGTSGCPLTKLVLEKTDGNPNAVVQLLQLLKTKNLLTFSNETHSWAWNMNVIESEVSDNPSEIIAQKLEHLDKNIVETLRLAAYMSNSFTAELLNFVLLDAKEGTSVASNNIEDEIRRPSVAASLDTAIENGFIENIGSGTYKFCHDSIQHFLYVSVEAASDQERIHLRIARGLMKYLDKTDSVDQEEPLILLAASNATQGARHITEDEERIATMQLCQKAATLFALKASLLDTKKCLECAINLEKEADWLSNYELCIDIHTSYAETLGNTGFFEESDKAVDIALDRAKTFKDKLRAQCAKLRSLISRMSYDEALAWACDVVLKDLGEKFLKRPSVTAVLKEALRAKVATRKMRPDDYLTLPEVEDERKLGAMMVTSILIPVAYILQNPLLFLYITFRDLRLYLRYGNSPYASLAAYAALLGVTGKMGEARELMRVMLKISSRKDFCPTSRVGALTSAYAMINPWHEHISASISPLLESFELGMKTNADLAGSFIGVSSYLDIRLHVGTPLIELEEEARRFCLLARDVQANQMLPILSSIWQYILNLLGKSEDPVKMTGEAMSEVEHLRVAQAEKDILRAQMTLMYRLQLEMSFGEWDAAKETSLLLLKNLVYAQGHYLYVVCSALIALTSLVAYEEAGLSKDRRTARKRMKMLGKWAKGNVPIAVPLFSLVKAEWIAAVNNEGWETTARAFDEAIASFHGEGLVCFETLAYDLGLRSMMRHINANKAQKYLKMSIERNREWGNVAKVEWIQTTYETMLRSVKPMFEVRVAQPIAKITEKPRIQPLFRARKILI